MLNLTPLHCQQFYHLPPSGKLEQIFVIKVTLDLVPGNDALRAQGRTHTLKLSGSQFPVALRDVYHGEFLKSSLRAECELLPPKLKCDVIFNGNAEAPRGKPCRRFKVSIKVSAPDRERPTPPRPKPIGYGMDVPWRWEEQWRQETAHAKAHPIPGELLAEKCLQVTGERWLVKRSVLTRIGWWFIKVGSLGLIRRCPWSLTRLGKLTSLPLRYEYAYGGCHQVEVSDAWSHRVPKRNCRPGVDKAQMLKAWKTSRTPGVLAEGWWMENLVGRCYAPSWLAKAARLHRLPAPQIENPEHPFTASAAWKAMVGKAGSRTHPALKTHGFGVTARNAPSRVQFAGTADQAWADSGAPYPPDYSVAFNNCAHPDLQCRHLEGDERVELINLCALTLPGVCQDHQGNQLLRFHLPGLFPFLSLVYDGNRRVQVNPVLDTLILEPQACRVTLLHRARFPAEPAPERVELRLAMPGEPREARCHEPTPPFEKLAAP